MSPLSTGVLGAATLVSSPALWLGLVDRTLPLDVALTRYLVAVVICWALLSVVTTWAFPDPGSIKAAPANLDNDDRRERAADGTVHDDT
jgi:hypothetical protein